MPPAAESLDDAEEGEELSNTDKERAAGISMNRDEDLHEAMEMLAELDIHSIHIIADPGILEAVSF
jgi:hypothetical protein